MTKTYIDKNGYRRFIGSNKLVHRWVAEKYLDRPLVTFNGRYHRYIVHHKDGNKLNNNPDNLEWVSKKEHMDKHPRIKKKIEKQRQEKLKKQVEAWEELGRYFTNKIRKVMGYFRKK